MGMSLFDHELESRLAALREQGLHRVLRRIETPQGAQVEFDGRRLTNFSSNDYLGLANHPALTEAAARAARDHGAGSGSSRLICGSLRVFHDLEEQLALFKEAEAALTFSTGYAAALGAVTSLLGANDIVVLDKLAHACLIDAARLSGAKLRVFQHNDLEDLERILNWAAPRRREGGERRQVLIITESIFSMDGDQAPLRQLVEMKERHGAWLMVDEAHATGLYGHRGAGVVGELGLSGQVEVQMGTLGKALGASGGFLCGSQKFMDFLVNRARSFIFSTAPVPAAAAAASAALRLLATPEGHTLRAQLWQHVDRLRSQVAFPPETPRSAIVPVILGDEALAMAAFRELLDRGLFIPAVRYPTVPRGSARLRVTLSAAHQTKEIDTLAEALRSHLPPA
jgi:8-amino-7-oxononanoate synthase